MALEMIEDMGVADIITVRSAKSTISGGMWVVASSGTWAAVVEASGTVASFTSNAITSASVQASGTLLPIGLAIQDAASGTKSMVGVLRKGTVIVACDDAIICGQSAAATNAADGEALVGVATAVGEVVGTSYSDTGSGTNLHCILRLDL